MPITVAIATIIPFAIYLLVGLAKKSRSITVDDYFIFSQETSAEDYANTSVGYAFQMAAIFLFAYWGVLYGLGALWTPLFWLLGFGVLYLLIPKFVHFHSTKTTLHQYLGETFGAGRAVQSTAAVATIIGLWGTMMAEIDYVMEVYSPVIPDVSTRYIAGAIFLLFGVIYIVQNGYKAEVRTERLQVPFAYAGLIAVLLLSLPSVRRNGTSAAYDVTLWLLAISFIAMLVAKLQLSWRQPARDPQIVIPILALAGLYGIHQWAAANVSSGNVGVATALNYVPLGQGLLGLSSLFIANVFWMPVDLSTWQRVASVKGESTTELVRNLRRGTLRVMLESPASWCLGVALGFVIQSGGFLPSGADASVGLSSFAAALQAGVPVVPAGWVASWLYPLFIISCISIMLSTVDSLISAIAFTAYRDLPPYFKGNRLRPAKLWTIGITVVGLLVYPVLRYVLGAQLPTMLYTAYSAQLALLVVVAVAMLKRRLKPRAAVISIVFGIVSAFAVGGLAAHTGNPAIAVLPPIFAVAGATIGFLLGYSPESSNTAPHAQTGLPAPDGRR